MSLFFSLLAALADLGIVVGVLMLLAPRLPEGIGRPLLELRALVAPASIWLAWLVAAVATFGSLYFSEAAHFLPCKMCWFQRIGMYPLALILGIAAFRRDLGVRVYAVPLAVLGSIVSSYHYLIEWFPQFESGSCDPTVPCTLIWFRRLGFMTLPYMALTGFVSIVVLLALPGRPRDDSGQESSSRPIPTGENLNDDPVPGPDPEHQLTR